jgi:hypothetical protein
MGNYATLEGIAARCPHCGHPFRTNCQFYLGDLTDCPHYNFGDAIKWSGSGDSGPQGESLIFAVGYTEVECPRHVDHLLLLVRVENNRVVSTELFSTEPYRDELLFIGAQKRPWP